MNVLAGDIGGTKTWLQIANYNNGKLATVFEKRFVSGQYPDFDKLLKAFIDEITAANIKLPPRACIGVAGPVASGRSKVTNLPWQLDEAEIQNNFGIDVVRLVNDFQAIGYGVEVLENDEVITLQAGEMREDQHLPCVLIGAGTGLGQGILVWQGEPTNGHYEVLPSEGGHTNFAPGNQDQLGLLNYLYEKQQRVCVEDLLSGRGLITIYEYLTTVYSDDVDPALTQLMQGADAAAIISEAALNNSDQLAGKALDLFVSIYGSQAGNLALTCMATGGVYIAGGIAPKIKQRLLDRTFLTAFHNKGPMTAIMKTIPVKLIVNHQVGLKGAAVAATRL